MASSKHGPTPEMRLKRFLYTSSEDPRYITGNAELHKAYTPDKLTAVSEILLSQKPELVLNVVDIVNSEKLLPRSETIFFALAVAVCSTTSEKLKHEIYTTLINIIKNSEDLCTFLKFYTKQHKKFGSGINKVISSYYMKKDPVELADEVSKRKGYHSWTHKDLIKLTHCRCESVLTAIVINYILFGLEKAKAAAEGNSAATEIINRLSKVQELKRCESEKRIVELVSELSCTNLIEIPSYYHRSQVVWEALLPQLPVRDLITYLPKLYKLGFLKANTPFQNKVVECLTNTETIQASKIHPVEVFIDLRNFEKGGKPLDPKFLSYLKRLEEENKDDSTAKKAEPAREAPKCPNVVSALHRAMQLSFQNVQSTGRKYMITIDIGDKMQGPCLNCKNLSCLDAAVICTLSLLRAEKDVTIAVFNDNKITLVSLEKNISFNQAVSKLKQAKHGYVMLSPVFEWAMNKKKPIDVFINFIYFAHWFSLIPKELKEKEKPLEALRNYRKKVSLPHSKLITCSLSNTHLSLADGSSNILDICGFSKEVPKVVEAFSKGLFY